MGENLARDRIANDFEPEFPKKDIICRGCKSKRAGVLGYRTAYCEAYPEGKPNDILFEGAECLYYMKDG